VADPNAEKAAALLDTLVFVLREKLGLEFRAVRVPESAGAAANAGAG
jgi:hypothetical protein